MDEIAHLELSPGTIRITPCNKCNNDAFTFDIVALNDTTETWSIAWAGTIHRCGHCEGLSHG